MTALSSKRRSTTGERGAEPAGVPPRKRLCIGVASIETVRSFLLNHIAALSQRFDITVVANSTDFLFLEPLGPSVTHATVRVERDIKPMRDLAALWRLLVLFWGGGYAAVYSVTPKAGLLAMLAGWIARVPVRVHTFTGQVWATARGPRRTALRGADRLIAALATHVLADSHSQMAFIVEEGVLKPGKARVLASAPDSSPARIR